MRTLIPVLLLAGCGLNPISKAPGPDDSGDVNVDDFLMIGDIRVSPATLSFGAVLLNSDDTIEVTLTNLGDAEAELSSAYLEGDTAFGITTTAPEAIVTGGSAVVTVSFSPTAEQDYLGTLNLLIAGESDIAALDISGIGSLTVDTDTDTGDTTGGGDGTLSLESTTVDFGKVPIGTTAGRSIEVTNTGGTDVLIKEVTSTASVFIGDLGVPLVLSPGESEDLLIQYVPTAETTSSGTLTIVNDSARDPEVSVTGMGYEACDICESRIQVTTGGTDSAYTMDQFKASSLNNPDEQSLFIQNTGDMPLTISGIAITNDTNAPSEITCGTDGVYSLGSASFPIVLEEFGSTSVPVRFKYNGSGFVCGEFSIDSSENVLVISSDADNGTSYTVTLGGGYSLF